MQNCLARVVTWSPRFFHSAPILKSLHWLSVRYHIIFKIYNYLSSTNSNVLFVPSAKINVGTRACSVAALTLELTPVSAKSVGNITFPHKLKTHLFEPAYPP